MDGIFRLSVKWYRYRIPLLSNICLKSDQFSFRSVVRTSNRSFSANSACSFFLASSASLFASCCFRIRSSAILFSFSTLSFSSLSLFLRSSSSLRFCSSANLTSLSCSNSLSNSDKDFCISVYRFLRTESFIRTISCVISSIICFASWNFR